MSLSRLNEYRIMWIMVFFDLPTETKKERKMASDFRKMLLQDGFAMFQYSIYLRHSASRENAEVHIGRIKKLLPSKGFVGILRITDKQFESMELFYGKEEKSINPPCIQLELF